MGKAEDRAPSGRVPLRWPSRLETHDRTRRGSAHDLVRRFRAELPHNPGTTFKLECFDLDEALVVMETLTAAEHRQSFVTWMVFRGRDAPKAPTDSPLADPLETK